MAIGQKSPLFSRKQPGGVYMIVNETMTTGDIWWVHSGTGTDAAGYGRNPDKPLATADYAVGLCTANQGDRIYLMPGHAEDLDSAGALDIDVAGVSVIGLGIGANRPTFTYTDSSATTLMGAASTYISNCRFVAGADNIARFVNCETGDNHIDNCLFQGGASYQWLNAIKLTTTKDNFTIKDCMFEQKTDPGGTNGATGTGGIFIVDSENIIIDNCIFYDQIETAAIHNKTTACKNLWVTNCRFYCSLSDMKPFVLVDGATGSAENCGGATPASTDVSDANLWGTLGASFWIGATSALGNDSAAGGQGSAAPTACE